MEHVSTAHSNRFFFKLERKEPQHAENSVWRVRDVQKKYFLILLLLRLLRSFLYLIFCFCRILLLIPYSTVSENL